MSASSTSPLAFGRRIFASLASFGLAIAVFGGLLLITWLGTLHQRDYGLYAALEKYFDSWFVLAEFPAPHDWIKFPFLGGYTLMALFFLNILCGGLLRIRKGKSTIGIIITHLSMAYLMFAGWVSFHWKTEGHLKLEEGQTSGIYTSYHDWVVEVAKIGETSAKVWQLPVSALASLQEGKELTISPQDHPFRLIFSNFHPNANVIPGTGATAIDGYVIQPLKPDKENERNVPAVQVKLVPTAGGATQPALLFGLERAPYTADLGGPQYTLRLTKMTYPMPFEVTLKDFYHEYYPNTDKPKIYRSDIARLDPSGKTTESRIEMNNPLRHEGYTLFQSGFGPQNGETGPPYSVFAVVKNPADHWPMYACIIGTIGLALHFTLKFLAHIRRSAAQRNKAAQPAHA
jgi:hypothetical protein